VANRKSKLWIVIPAVIAFLMIAAAVADLGGTPLREWANTNELTLGLEATQERNWQEAWQHFSKSLAVDVYTAAIVFILLSGAMLQYFRAPSQEPATREDINAALKDFHGEKPQNPSAQEVKSEIEKELAAAFKEKERRSLDLFRQGVEAYQNNRFKESITFYDAALGIVQTASIHLARGNSHCVTSSYPLAIQDYTEALKRYEKDSNRKREGSASGNLGLAYRSLGQHEKAIDHHSQALAISREIGDRQGEGNHLGNLSSAYYSLGQYVKAIDYHSQALAISREIGNRQGEGIDLGNLGSAYYSLGQHEKAIDHHNQALAISREIGDRQGAGNHLGNLGSVYHSLGQYEKAIDYYNEALAISREIGDRQGVGSDLGNLGIVYYSLGQYEKAIDYYRKALAIYENIQSPHACLIRENIAKLKAEME
jgi:tetratricopeptide (TPR) repeat protein